MGQLRHGIAKYDAAQRLIASLSKVAITISSPFSLTGFTHADPRMDVQDSEKVRQSWSRGCDQRFFGPDGVRWHSHVEPPSLRRVPGGESVTIPWRMSSRSFCVTLKRVGSSSEPTRRVRADCGWGLMNGVPFRLAVHRPDSEPHIDAESLWQADGRAPAIAAALLISRS